jgi:hypothetical protein
MLSDTENHPPVQGFDDDPPRETDAVIDAEFPEVGEEPDPDADRKPAPVYALIRYDVTDQRITELREQFAGLAERTPENYEPRRKAIATCRELRVAVEKKRKELKADSLAWGKKVDSVAKHYTGLLESIEEPLQLAKDADDAEKTRIRQEKEAAEKAALEAKVRAEREAEEARLKAEREAEEARLAEERKALDAERVRLVEERLAAEEAARVERERVEVEQRAERERLDAEGAKLKAEREAQAEAARVEQEKLAELRRSLDEQRDRAEREERERRLRLQVEDDAKAQAARDRVAAEEAAVVEAERKAELARRLEALKPDAEKLRAFAVVLRELRLPEVSSSEASAATLDAAATLGNLATRLETFGVV